MVLTKLPSDDGQSFCNFQEWLHVLQEAVTKIRVLIGTILTNELQFLNTNVFLPLVLGSTEKKCKRFGGLAS